MWLLLGFVDVQIFKGGSLQLPLSNPNSPLISLFNYLIQLYYLKTCLKIIVNFTLKNIKSFLSFTGRKSFFVRKGMKVQQLRK
jgi:hypothetical protein